jgi:hypothetical protein
MQLKDLKNRSLEVVVGTKVLWPDGRTGKLNMSETIARVGQQVFSIGKTRKGAPITIAFIDQDNHFFVTPHNPQSVNTLKENGFKESVFFVPFSHGEVPFANQRWWADLRKVLSVTA